MSTNNLGSLTLNLVADLGQYDAPIERAERLTKKAMREMGASVDQFGNYMDRSMKKAAEATKQLDSQFERLHENMQREIALYGDVSRAATLRYDLEKGSLKSLSAEQKRTLGEMATRLDAMDDATAAFGRNKNAVDQVTGSYRGLRGVATGLGYQVQDIAVQLQAGTNPMMVLGQQGSQIASLFGPGGAVIGALIAVGGAIAGALLPNLMKAGDTATQVADKVKGLVGELNELDAVQRKLVLAAQGYGIQDLTKEYTDQGKEVEKLRKEIERIQAMPDLRGSPATSVTMGTGGLSAGSSSIQLNKTELLAEATRKLNAAQISQLATMREIEDAQDPTGGMQRIRELNDELELIGLTGEELHRKAGEQKGYTDGLLKEYVALELLIDLREEEAKAEEKARKDREAAAKRAREDEKNRREAIEKAIKAMEREADLYGVTSRAAQAEYDILNQILKIQGGLEGVEGSRYMTAARRLDQLEAEKSLNEALNIEIDARIEKQKEDTKYVDKYIKDLKDQEAQLRLSAEAYTELQLRARGADDAQIEMAQNLAVNIEALKESQKQVDQFFERLDQVGVSVWADFLEGTRSAMDALKKLFYNTLAELAHAAITRPIILQVQQQFVGGGAAGGANAAGALAGGLWAAGAVAVVGAINSWNKAQDERVKEFTSEYRQGVQSTGTILGENNAKSESIANAISGLGDLSGKTLDVNRGMYQALLDIRSGIQGVSAGVARQIDLNAGGIGPAVSTGTSSAISTQAMGYLLGGAAYGVTQLIGGELGSFVNNIVDGVSKAVYSSKKKVIDSGIAFGQQTLADIITDGAVEAFGYAAVNTKKKFLGVTTSNKVKQQFSDLDEALLDQFSTVFEGAGDVLAQAAGIFGVKFDDYVNQLVLPAQNLSLKGLEGDELVKEIESFFSSTLDNWAEVLTGGTDVLGEFQQVGEGAFETMVRLAGELNTFNHYVDALNLNFNLAGAEAIKASQNIAQFAGGFGNLSAAMAGYYENFFTEEERAAKQMEQLAVVLASIGIDAVPQSRDQLRSIIESLDLSKTANQEIFATLIGLADVFADVTPALSDAVDGIGLVFGKLKDAVDLERERLDEANDRAMDRINESLTKHRELADALSGALEGMKLESEKFARFERQQAQARIIAANAIAKAGGPLPNLESLSDALQTLSQPSMSMFSTFEEYARDFYRTRQNLAELQEAAGDRATIDEQALANQQKYHDEQIGRLDRMLEYYQTQIDQLNGIDTSVLTVAQAVGALNLLLAGQSVDLSTISPIASAPIRATVSQEKYGTVVAQAPDRTFTEILSEIKSLRSELETSQYAIAKNTQKVSTTMDRWETDGLPPERAEL